MRQFHAYKNRNANTRDAYPLLLNIQSDLIEETGTRVVIPLVPAARARQAAMSSLTPILDIKGESQLLILPLLAAVELTDLGREEADLSHQRTPIMAALDFLISGI
ncbi:plasmid maintenance protein CcdB [Lysobacter pythonis]|uniref:Toxin CcdB n=1 Tax=Solilutibacter pythonis TaxID=2483112 RepID=A0A3M2I1C7_9GAMM|nr:CcdB family protein [Lysobacter pythonis]RMH94185.1 plasmid maintenance protein CcdB [Lysobacter pythonis]